MKVEGRLQIAKADNQPNVFEAYIYMFTQNIFFDM